eukprot:TRINITY_DN4233_c0_g1_i2.p1 TRINITY_DN4233_c0_g1~~TRINITY_DN4233_c0_g1_i2.p1  ORF type:complete len:1412 (+),score=360.27 TRINITY_DN4233_c0_g1_i2:358-4593(+)
MNELQENGTQAPSILLPFIITQNLNERQLQAITAPFDKPLLISAGPGSGKTLTLVCRIMNMIASGISPRNLLAITFTKKAAQQMESRIQNAFSQSNYADKVDIKGERMTICTFHRFCLRILREQKQYLPEEIQNFDVFTYKKQESILRKCFSLWEKYQYNLENGLSNSSDESEDENNDKFENQRTLIMIPDKEPEIKKLVRYCLLFIGKAKANMWSHKNLNNTFQRFMYRKYDSLIRSEGGLDFNDFIPMVVKLMLSQPRILEHYRSKYQYILCDEFQDITLNQWILIKLLIQKSRRLTVVGDEEQSIYSFRGSNDLSFYYIHKSLFDGDADRIKRHTIRLNQNYRSTKRILDTAIQLIRNNKKMVKQVEENIRREELWTKNDIGINPVILECFNSVHEISQVLDCIEKEKNRLGISYSDVAILYRNRAIGKLFESELTRRKIRFGLNGRGSFYDREEIKDVLAYLRLIIDKHDNAAFLRVMNIPNRNLDKKAADLILKVANHHKISCMDSAKHIISNNIKMGSSNIRHIGLKKFVGTIEKLSSKDVITSCKNLPNLIDELIKRIGYIGYLWKKDDEKKKAISRKENHDPELEKLMEVLDDNPSSYHIDDDDEEDEDPSYSGGFGSKSISTSEANINRLKYEAMNFIQNYNRIKAADNNRSASSSSSKRPLNTEEHHTNEKKAEDVEILSQIEIDPDFNDDIDDMDVEEIKEVTDEHCNNDEGVVEEVFDQGDISKLHINVTVDEPMIERTNVAVEDSSSKKTHRHHDDEPSFQFLNMSSINTNTRREHHHHHPEESDTERTDSSSSSVGGCGDGSISIYSKCITMLAAFLEYVGYDLKSNSNERDCLTLTTIHQSKGLEWPVVCIVRANEGCLPSLYPREKIHLNNKNIKLPDNLVEDANLILNNLKLESSNMSDEDNKVVIEEERRLCYVAITRAEKILILSYIEYDSKTNNKIARSRFIDEIISTTQLIKCKETILSASPKEISKKSSSSTTNKTNTTTSTKFLISTPPLFPDDLHYEHQNRNNKQQEEDRITSDNQQEKNTSHETKIPRIRRNMGLTKTTKRTSLSGTSSNNNKVTSTNNNYNNLDNDDMSEEDSKTKIADLSEHKDDVTTTTNKTSNNHQYDHSKSHHVPTYNDTIDNTLHTTVTTTTHVVQPKDGSQDLFNEESNDEVLQEHHEDTKHSSEVKHNHHHHHHHQQQFTSNDTTHNNDFFGTSSPLILEKSPIKISSMQNEFNNNNDNNDPHVMNQPPHHHHPDVDPSSTPQSSGEGYLLVSNFINIVQNMDCEGEDSDKCENDDEDHDDDENVDFNTESDNNPNQLKFSNTLKDRRVRPRGLMIRGSRRQSLLSRSSNKAESKTSEIPKEEGEHDSKIEETSRGSSTSSTSSSTTHNLLKRRYVSPNQRPVKKQKT